jgi:hypothetical protein
MIQHLQERFHGRSNFGMIINPADFWIDISFHRNLNFETVTVHAPAFVTLRHGRQGLRRFEGEILGQPGPHVAEDSTDTSALSLLVVASASCRWPPFMGWKPMPRSDSPLGRGPDEFVHLELKSNVEAVSQDPFHDLARIDPTENGRKKNGMTTP